MKLAAVLILVAHLSYYDPALCSASPINCWDSSYWWQMSAGTDAREWYGRALACPIEFPFGSTWRLPGVRGDRYHPPQDWICLDRGGRIRSSVLSDGTIRVILDLLTPHQIVSDVVAVEYRGPVPHALLARLERIAESCADKERC